MNSSHPGVVREAPPLMGSVFIAGGVLRATRSRLRSLRRPLGVALVVGGMLLIWISSSAQAAGIYWTTDDLQSISRADVDGTNVNNNFGAGDSQAIGIAADADFVYWTVLGGTCEPRPGADNCPGIIRADSDGTNVTRFLFSDPFSPIFRPQGIAINDSFVYWTEGGSIARANRDGTGVDHDFISSVGAGGLAVDENFLYWADDPSGTIGRANLDGTGVITDFITGALAPSGVAVDGTYIYWTNIPLGSGTIGRAKLDGTGVDQSFITGALAPFGVAVDGTYLYWTNSTSNTIGRAKLDGTGVDQGFITGASPAVRPFPVSIAVVPVPEPTTGLLMVLGVLCLTMNRRWQRFAA